MISVSSSAWAATALTVACMFCGPAGAATQAVKFNVLNASATLPTPLLAGDNLVLDTLVTAGVGALQQTINFVVGSGVGELTGSAGWQISTATGTGPRLIGVNIDIFDASNALVASDAFEGILAGFAHSSFAAAIGPGNYKLVATGTGVRDSSLDLSLEFMSSAPQPVAVARVVPEPGTYALLLAGLATLGFVARRRQH